jgi:hypothetical protein
MWSFNKSALRLEKDKFKFFKSCFMEIISHYLNEFSSDNKKKKSENIIEPIRNNQEIEKCFLTIIEEIIKNNSKLIEPIPLFQIYEYYYLNKPNEESILLNIFIDYLKNKGGYKEDRDLEIFDFFFEIYLNKYETLLLMLLDVNGHNKFPFDNTIPKIQEDAVEKIPVVSKTPIEIIRKHFAVFYDNKYDLIFLSKIDTNTFIERAFLGKTSLPKQTFNNITGKIGLIIYRFKQLYEVSLNHEARNRDKYIRILSDNFYGFNFDSIKPNFSKSPKKKWD